MKLNNHLVLVKADKPLEKDGDIFVAEEWQQLPPSAIVEAVADDVTFCKPGDKVFFERYSAIKFEGDRRLCREDGILVVYDGA